MVVKTFVYLYIILNVILNNKKYLDKVSIKTIKNSGKKNILRKWRTNIKHYLLTGECTKFVNLMLKLLV